MDLEQKSIERIKMASEMSLHHYGKPLVCTYSGGKDSDVMLELFKRSGVPFEVHHSHTTVDAPQTVYHVRDIFRDLELAGIPCTIHMPPITMWNLIAKKKIPPSRRFRYCCDVFKENSTPNRFVATGVRWDESPRRSKRQEIEPRGKKLAMDLLKLDDNDRKRALIERCEIKSDMIVNPIVDWLDCDVWEYYWTECKRHNFLYHMGYTRVGCIGCPMARKHRWKEFTDFPTYQRAYIRAFDKMLEAMRNDGTGRIPTWKNGNDVFDWWMEDDNIEGQLSMFDDVE